VLRVAAVARSDAQVLPLSGINPRPRLSIVVLPFANLSDDREQQYFADGITEDLTTDLSRIVDSFVISRNTAFTYRNKPVDTKQIGRELGVRYVLEGSVRRSGNQLRVTAQLIDAENVESGHSGLSASTQTDLKPTKLRRSEASAPSIRECLPCRLGALTVCFSIKAGARPAHDQALGFP
jgi:TolB-like protein